MALIKNTAPSPPIFDEIFLPFRDFIKKEESGGFLLFIATVIALIWANSPLHHYYERLWETRLTFEIGTLHFSKTLLHFINDGLMALFFFVIGLEMKREILVGALSSFRQALLPVVAAIGGMIVPAAIYLALNAGTPASRGWGIPMATDIAFALGILALLGRRVPISLKVFLTAVAVADDIGAIIIIALFYTSEIGWTALITGSVLIFMLWGANRSGIKSTMVYSILGIGLWLAFVKSGIHATVAGVIVAMTIPVHNKYNFDYFVEKSRMSLKIFEKEKNTPDDILSDREKTSALQNIENICQDVGSPLLHLEHALHPWVTIIIIPLFALANAGVQVQGDFVSALLQPITAGVACGLLLGKQTGIFLGVWLMVKLKWSALPKGLSMFQIYGMSWLCGIGFTMSLLITGLAFTETSNITYAKIGILSSSLLAGVVGWGILRGCSNMPEEKDL